MPSLFDTERQEKLAGAMAKVMNGRDDIALVWLEGALASGSCDRYSDVDLHVAVEDEDLEAFCADRWRLLNSVGDPVIIREVGGPVCQLMALFDNGVLLRLTAEKASQLEARPRESVRILLDRDGYSDELEVVHGTVVPVEFRKERITRDISEFWLSVASFPREVRRGTPVALCQSHIALLRALMVRMLMMLKDGGADGGGGRGLDLSVDGHGLEEVESSADAGPTMADTWRTLVRVCQLFSRYARKACAAHGLMYPEAMEVSVRAYVYCELNDKLNTSDWWKP